MNALRAAIAAFTAEHHRPPTKIILSEAHHAALMNDASRRLWMNETLIRGIPYEVGAPAGAEFELV